MSGQFYRPSSFRPTLVLPMRSLNYVISKFNGGTYLAYIDEIEWLVMN